MILLFPIHIDSSNGHLIFFSMTDWDTWFSNDDVHSKKKKKKTLLSLTDRHYNYFKSIHNESEKKTHIDERKTVNSLCTRLKIKTFHVLFDEIEAAATRETLTTRLKVKDLFVLLAYKEQHMTDERECEKQVFGFFFFFSPPFVLFDKQQRISK